MELKKKDLIKRTNRLNERRRIPTTEISRKLSEPSGRHPYQLADHFPAKDETLETKRFLDYHGYRKKTSFAS